MLSSEIKSQVNDVLERFVGGFQGFSLDTYAKNKAQFYKDFGDKFIISKEINLSISHEFKMARMKRSVDYDLSGALKELIIANGVDGFFENKIKNDLTLETPKGPVTIKAGMKLSKAFKFFIENEHLLNRNQTQYSKAINDSVLSGTLSISCHPLDYLSMSMNKHGWSSCQSLTGDYASGTLSLMNDKTTLIGYLSDGTFDHDVFDMVEPYWNSKRFRVLIHIDPTRKLVYISRNYPYTAVPLENALLDMIREIYPDSQFEDLAKADQDFINRTKTGGYDTMHYSDLSSSNSVKYSVGKDFNEDNFERMVIGHSALCCKCESHVIQEAFEYCCYDCSEHRFCCDCCGDGGFSEDDMIYIGNDMVCHHCVDDCYTECEECGELGHNDNTYYFEETDRHYCEYCYNEAVDEYNHNLEDDED